MDSVLAQGSPGSVIEPLLAPCCGGVLAVAFLVIYIAAGRRQVDIGDRRHTVYPKRLGLVIGVTVAVYLAAIVGWHRWDFRTRVTTIKLIDARTGKPVPLTGHEVFMDFDSDSFQSSETVVAPGTYQIVWNHHCHAAFQVPGYADPFGHYHVALNDDTPKTIELRLDP